MARLLVVDDDPDFLAFAAEALRAGHDVEGVDDGREALDRLATGTYDLVLSDVDMPGVNGFRMAERAARRSDLRIVFTSSRDHRGEALLRGGVDFVPKPVTPAGLRRSIDAALGRDRCDAGAVLLVESDAALRALFTTALDGLRVVTAADTAGAVAALTAHPDVALVLADHGPAVDAVALVEALRANGFGALPVIVHTALAWSARQDLAASLVVEAVFEKTAFLKILLATTQRTNQ